MPKCFRPLQILLLLCAAASGAASASTASDGTSPGPHSATRGEYTIHYRALRTSQLPRSMAEAHDLPFGTDAILLTVAVSREGQTVPADIEARATNLARQIREIPMRPMRANERVSYAGVLDLDAGATLDFELDIAVEGRDAPIEIAFRERFTESVPGRPAREADAAPPALSDDALEPTLGD